MNGLPKMNTGGCNGTRNSMSDMAAIKASLKAAMEAEARLTVSIRHSEKIGALPPNLMAGQRDLYEAMRFLASAITRLEESNEKQN
jgi:hypothetical protein